MSVDQLEFIQLAIKRAGNEEFPDSLDAHSEQRVMQALSNASTQQTTLMVTHQLAGLAEWDAIWVMQDGQIVEQGGYAQLSAAGGAFASLLAHRQEEI